MEYIVYKRFKENAICGKVNIPATTVCNELKSVIYYNGKPLCAVFSQNAHDHFARNDDGKGLLRGELIQSIMQTLNNRDLRYQERWDRVWADPICQKYKRSEYADYWLWNHDFYNANIYDLQYIINLIGIKNKLKRGEIINA